MPCCNPQLSAIAGTIGAEGATPRRNLIRDLKSDDDGVRTAAWLAAGDVGAPAIRPLAALMVDEPMEVARAAKRAAWRIVRHCGRPGAGAERRAVNKALRGLLPDKHPAALRRDVLWMLSETGEADCVKPIARLLRNTELRDTARMALERIPGDVSLAALKAALDTVPGDFKPNVAQSLRNRGVDVAGYPSAKLTPVKPTGVKPL